VRRVHLVGVLALVLAATGIAAAGVFPNGRIGPKLRIQNNGRKLDPYGKMTTLGNFPTGGSLTTDGRFLWTLAAGRGKNDVQIVRVLPRGGCKSGSKGAACRKQRRREVGRVVQRIPMPGVSGGMVMAADNRTAYVSGTKESSTDEEKSPAGTPGKAGDVIHVFKYDASSGKATRDGVISVPPPSDAPAYQTFPPGTTKRSWPRDLAITSDGKTLLAALNLADRAAVIDTKARSVRYVATGNYPYGAAISRDGRLGFIGNETQGSNEAQATVSVIDLKSTEKVKDIQVGPHLSHPEGMAADPTRDLLFVALANEDLIKVIDTKTLAVKKTLSVGRTQGTGTTPTALRVTRDGCDLLSADSGEDAVAVFAISPVRRCDSAPYVRRAAAARLRRPVRPFKLVGRVPTGAYPTAVDATPDRKQLVWISARGLGTGPNTGSPLFNDPGSSTYGSGLPSQFKYLPSFVHGSSGIGSFPSDARIKTLSQQVSRQLIPTDAESRPAGSPIAPPTSRGGPSPQKIQHVFYIVKENRTYDQVLGKDARGDGDPKLELFGENVTPNLHALAKRFPLLDHVYANSEASIDGHYWTSAGAVSDYVTKNWHQNYGGRGRPYDFGAYVVTQPPRGYLFQRAEREGVSYYNFGEALAGVSPLPDKDRDTAGTQMAANVLSHSDIGIPQPATTDPPNTPCYDSDISNSSVLSQHQIEVYDNSLLPGTRGNPSIADVPPGSRSRFDCFNVRFTRQVATNSVPAFSYLVLPNNHTEGTTNPEPPLPRNRTPRAQVASNDAGLGQIVDLISHSSVWGKSLILVDEDDSQDGADHVDAHRMPALVISPYAKQGAVVHTRYDQLSFIRTLEIIVGLKPLHLPEAFAVPLYDALSSSPQNAAPYNAVAPTVSITERNPNTAQARRDARRFDFGGIDRVPQRELDRMLWQSIHGPHSTPPPPGPNASGIDEADGR
jgi:phosphoesterase family protein